MPIYIASYWGVCNVCPLIMIIDVKYLAAFKNLSQAQFSNEQKGNLIQRRIAFNTLINVKKLVWQCMSKPDCRSCVCVQYCLAQSKLRR